MHKINNKEGTFSGFAFGAVSIIIIGFLGCQAIAGFLQNWRFYSYSWPFISYPMYSGAHYEGERIPARTLVFGRQEDGQEVEIVPEDLNLRFFKFEKNFARQIRPENKEKLKVYIEIYEQRHGKRFTELRSTNYPMILGREGAIPAPSETLHIVDVSDLYGEGS